MRANSPLNPLVETKSTALPSPSLAIGTRLDLKKVASYNQPVLIRRVVRSVITRTRKTIDRARRAGSFPQMRGRKMLDCHKQVIRDILQFMETADSVEVAGHSPSELVTLGNIANESYLAAGSSTGGWAYAVHVLFRKEVDGRKLAYTYPDPLMSEHNASFCVIAR